MHSTLANASSSNNNGGGVMMMIMTVVLVKLKTLRGHVHINNIHIKMNTSVFGVPKHEYMQIRYSLSHLNSSQNLELYYSAIIIILPIYIYT